ncbi:hypothetical protein [Salipiger abyssi]|uniref:hypothetical protein n=1 Tax=Salipiger abyssi TaxID=1250539 RepID=UPI001A8C529E|nr:hypothetical protein [Salipiger abyssi]MBN9886641.1 hypothetical protein [Salipiger abyssi]
MGRIRRNSGRIALIAVLAVSLLGNALTAGALLRFKAMRSELLGPVAEAAVFPREVRRDLRAALAENADTLRPALHDLARARAAIISAGTAEPFDRAEVEAAMDVFRGEAEATIAQVQAVVLEVLAARAGSE